jgi:hypothetical protein
VEVENGTHLLYLSTRPACLNKNDEEILGVVLPA